MKTEISLPLLKKDLVNKGKTTIDFDFENLDDMDKIVDKANNDNNFWSKANKNCLRLTLLFLLFAIITLIIGIGNKAYNSTKYTIIYFTITGVFVIISMAFAAVQSNILEEKHKLESILSDKNYTFAKSILDNADILNKDNVKSKTNVMFIKNDSNIELNFNISNKNTIYSTIPLSNVQFSADTDTITIIGNLDTDKNNYILSAIMPLKYRYNEIILPKA